DVHVRHQWPPNFTAPAEGHWVMVQPWEFGSLPKTWIANMVDRVDEVWAYTNFVRECYIDSGLPAGMVHVVPLGVDAQRFTPAAPARPLNTRKNFRFLFVGGTIWRKGIDVLLEAYLKAFTAKDDVCLVVKDMGGGSFYSGQTAGEWIKEITASPDAPEILYLDEDLPPSDLPGLYTACDCLAHPYRGEGFALPVAEAMACGLPVIVTDGGACHDFCDGTVAFMIPAQRLTLPEKRIGDLETVGYPFVYEPDVAETARLMRLAFENPEAGRGLGAAARKRVEERLTWRLAAERAVERMREISRRPIRRHGHGSAGRSNADNTDNERTVEAFIQETLARANAAVAGGDLGRAAEIFRELAAEYPTLTVAHAALGSVLVATGDLDAAVKALARAAELSPEDVAIRNQLGVALFNQGAEEKAVASFQAAIDLAPDNLDAILNLAHLHRTAGRYGEASELIKRAMSLDATNADVLAAFGTLCLELGDAESGQLALSGLSLVAPEHPAVQALAEALAGQPVS
ncbi:MAG: tetratricopeptide repeat protein, partial [Chloroflexota bacterium]